MVGLVFQLRQKWHGLFLRRIRSPSKPWSQLDENTIRALVSVLGAEDPTAGLQQPTGIGQRPRPISSEDPPQTSSWRNANSKRTPGPTGSTDDELFIPNPSQTATDRSSRLSPAWALLQPKVFHGSRDMCSKLSADDHSSTTNSPESASLCLHSPCASPSPTSSGKCSKSPSPRPGGVTVRYFIMKSSNLRNIDIPQQRGIWSTTPSNELKLNRAFLESSLVFSVQGSGHFQVCVCVVCVCGMENSRL
uniref:YTH domain-containing family protein n=1 Tax=Hucho hucho TaxID=62062 RepID=A0A4W5QAA6_9TELE